VETDSADFGDAIADRCDGILAEREAAVPAATEALRRIADEGWERSRKPGDDAAVLAEMAETALASPEPTPDSGLDVERLYEAWGNVMDGRRVEGVRLMFDTTTVDDWKAITAEYARLSEEPA
jgi:hypothetical protein